MFPQFQNSLLKALFSEKPPETLYHYTNKDGFQGITRGKTIRIGHHRYLNDAMESRYFRELFAIEVANCTRYSSRVIEPILDVLHEKSGFEEVNVYLASFSEECDSPSQWSGYSDHGRGFALGLKLAEVDLQPPDRFSILRVRYDPAEQREIAQAVISEIAMHSGIQMEAFFVRRLLHLVAPGIKDPNPWAREREWRIVSDVMADPPLSPKDPRPERTIGGKPFRTIPLLRIDGAMALRDVWIGPNSPDSIPSVHRFLDGLGLDKVEIFRSKSA